MLENYTKLLQFTKVFGPPYGTEDSSIFLHSIVKMHRPAVILELGTGLGVCAFQMAMAVKENNYGHVYTVDNGSHWGETSKLVEQHSIVPPGTDYPGYLATVAEWLDLEPFITFIDQTLPPYPDLDEPIDLLFNDFQHGPQATLNLIAFYLPRLSDCSSIFIDSASTLRETYDLLEALIPQMDAGTVPEALKRMIPEAAHGALADLVAKRRFKLVHLTEVKDRSQNSMAWIKIEPREGGPYPLTKMREH